MSLDVSLFYSVEEFLPAADLLEEKGFLRAAEYLREEVAKEHLYVYDSNITHNLGRMADAAGIYHACWWPEEIGVTKARQLIPLLREGLIKLRSNPEYFRTFNAANGWGTYEQFVPWVQEYLDACEQYPDAEVRASR